MNKKSSTKITEKSLIHTKNILIQLSGNLCRIFMNSPEKKENKKKPEIFQDQLINLFFSNPNISSYTKIIKRKSTQDVFSSERGEKKKKRE